MLCFRTNTLFDYMKSRTLKFPLNIVHAHRDEFTTDFVEWIPDNIHIFNEFCDRARALKNKGRKRYGAKGIMETIRYDTILRQNQDFEWKLNNNHTAYLSRLAMIAYPELNGFFETRETRSI